MIIILLLNLLLLIFGTIFSFLPVVTISSIPYIGPGIVSMLDFAVQIWNGFIDTFPYADYAWHIFLLVILPFEALMLVAKFFLGARKSTIYSQ